MSDKYIFPEGGDFSDGDSRGIKVGDKVAVIFNDIMNGEIVTVIKEALVKGISKVRNKTYNYIFNIADLYPINSPYYDEDGDIMLIWVEVGLIKDDPAIPANNSNNYSSSSSSSSFISKKTELTEPPSNTEGGGRRKYKKSKTRKTKKSKKTRKYMKRH